MKKFWIQIIILLVLIFGSLYLFTNSQVIETLLPLSSSNANTQIKIGGTTLQVEVANTAGRRSKGLGGRENLASGSGMLFVFPEEKKYQFWMKDMKFPIDFIFIKGGKIVDILSNVPPPQPNQKTETLPIYQPITAIDMMLEVNSGFIQANRIKIGDTVYLINP